MLSRRFHRTESKSVVINVFLEHETYNKFKAYQVKNGLDESHALVDVFSRGMANYWLQEFKQLKQAYLPMEKMFTEFKKDHELFEALQHENEELKRILKDKSREEKS